MATKKFLLEVEEGVTKCHNCPFSRDTFLRYYCNKVGVACFDNLDCDKLNLATMKIREMEEEKDE